MEDNSETSQSQVLSDTRSRAHGWPLAFMVLLGIAAVVFAWRGIISVTESVLTGDAVAAITTGLAVITWILGTVGIVHNGRRMRIVAYVCWILNLIGALIGALVGDAFAVASPWYGGGVTYYFLPTVAAALAIAWLYWSAPANVASRGAAG